MSAIWQRMQDDMQLAGLAVRTQETYGSPLATRSGSSRRLIGTAERPMTRPSLCRQTVCSAPFVLR